MEHILIKTSDKDPKLLEIEVQCITQLVQNEFTVGATMGNLIYEALEKAHRLGWNDCFDDLKGKGRND